MTLEFGPFGNQKMLQVLSDDQKLQQSGKLDWSDDNTLDVKHAMQEGARGDWHRRHCNGIQ